MPLSLLIRGLQVSSTAEHYRATEEGLVLKGRSVSLEPQLPVVRNYLHGWQSWSLSTWLEAGRRLPPSHPSRLHCMQIDPAYANHPLPLSAWLGAVEFPDRKILLLGALGLDAHVEYTHGLIHGWYESDAGEWLAVYGTETEVFAAYVAALALRLGRRAESPAPRVWCSWYSYFTDPDEVSLGLDLEAARGLPFDVFQLDDGWELDIGDWEPNERFPAGMDAFARRIRIAGFTPGLWLAPLIASRSSRLFNEHPDWFLRDEQSRLVSAGHSWGGRVYALDLTYPPALEWLVALVNRVRGWGYDYLKLDYLFAGALPGKRHIDVPREAALRQVLQTLRECLGEAYLLACGAPILPCLGLCDGLRIGPDVADHWVNSLDSEILFNFATPGAQNALRTSVNRLWLKQLIHTDPDVVYFRGAGLSLNYEQKSLLRDLALIAGFKGTSDRPRALTNDEREALREFLEADPTVLRLDRYRYSLAQREVDFAPHVSLPPGSALQPGRMKRFVQRRSNSEMVLSVAYRWNRFLQRRRLRK